jgi:hypothetical protein
MLKHIRFSSLVVIIILLSFGGVTLTQAQQTVNSVSTTYDISQKANQPWYSQYIHQVSFPDDVGTYASLALRPFDDIPYISYYDATNGDLMLAHFLPHGGGNCGTDNNWYCEVLDGDADHGGGNVGTYTSIAFWADEANQTWRIGISYHDVTHHGLKFISWICNELTCSYPIIVTIASNPGITVFNTGLFTSLKFTADGDPYIAYHTKNTYSGTGYLQFAYSRESGGNCGEGSAAGKWDCTKIDSGPGVGQYVSLDMSWVGWYIAYYDAGYGNLKLASSIGGGGNCGLYGQWQCDTLDGEDGSDVGLYTSIIAPQQYDGPVRIAYYDKTHGQLKFYNSGSTVKLVVDDIGFSDSPTMGISIAVDKEGYPIIAYQKVEQSFRKLYIARPYFVYNSSNSGNCGDIPPDLPFRYWTCALLDPAGQYLSVADYVSAAVNSSGLAQIAYSEFNDADESNAATSLKYLYQNFFLHNFLPVINKH